MMFIKTSPNSHGFVNPRHLEEMWRDQFDWVYREQDYGVVTFTIHPDVSGRPQVLLMLERLIDAHQRPRRRPLGDLRRDRRRLHRPQPQVLNEPIAPPLLHPSPALAGPAATAPARTPLE